MRYVCFVTDCARWYQVLKKEGDLERFKTDIAMNEIIIRIEIQDTPFSESHKSGIVKGLRIAKVAY